MLKQESGGVGLVRASAASCVSGAGSFADLSACRFGEMPPRGRKAARFGLNMRFSGDIEGILAQFRGDFGTNFLKCL